MKSSKVIHHRGNDGSVFYTVETELETLRTDVTAVESDITAIQADVTAIQAGYIYSPLDMFRHLGTPVVGNVSTSFNNFGAAFSAGTHQIYAQWGLTIEYARWLVAWTPGHASNTTVLRLVHADSGPTNTTEIERFTQASATPRVDAVDVTTDLQDLVTGGVQKQIYTQGAGNGVEAPSLYLSMVEVVYKFEDA